ncbi:MAG: aldo/keto reductase, partial [Phycisphaerae bacterium]|nr:aldo/keto reductase [Phycisphaerae bacterium]
MSGKVKWGILGTGKIAHTLARAIGASRTGELVAVGSRRAETAAEFANEFNVSKAYASYDELLADADVQAIYISLPNHLHAEWTIKCAEAGKHILCEKPLATNHAEAMAAVDAVRFHDVFLMEAFMYRCHPQTARLAEMIRDGAIGEVRLIQSNFSYNMGPQYENIRLSNPAAGGAIMDVGCYTVSISRLVAGASLGTDFAQPVEVKGCAHIGDVSRVDEQSTAALKFDGGIVANVACGTQVAADATLCIWGSKGHILVANPWFPGKGESHITLRRDGAEAEDIVVTAEDELYSIEVDTVARHIENRQAPAPCMTWEDSLGNMRILDRWRKSVGLVFDAEKGDALKATVSKRPLKTRPGCNMRYIELPGLEKKISQLVMGTMIFSPDDMPFACAMFDNFVERGGNCFDTAYVYGGGNSEPALGEWMRLRGNRDELVVIGKGAHTPNCNVESLTRELNETLERLGTDYLDIYLLHRDDPGVPVSEFVDCLIEHVEAGRIRLFGGSNWTLERIAEAREYARSRGRIGFTVSSSNLCMATWNEPMWAGSISASDARSRAWHEESQTALFAWSSQANGFFSGRFSPEDRSDSDMVRVWH